MVTHTTMAQQIADAVRERIAATGHTVLGVSEATGISRPTLTRRLIGATPFNVDELDRIATVLGVSLTELAFPAPRKAAA